MRAGLIENGVCLEFLFKAERLIREVGLRERGAQESFSYRTILAYMAHIVFVIIGTCMVDAYRAK